MTDTPIIGAPDYEPSQSQPWLIENKAKRMIEALARRGIVQDRDLTDPPGSCADGDCYLIKATAGGAWASHSGELAVSVGASAASGWYFVDVEKTGTKLWVVDEAIEIRWDGGAWISAGGDISALGDIPDVDVSTAADGYTLLYDESNQLWYAGPASGGGATAFTDLTDVPASYSGSEFATVRVNAAGTGLEFYEPEISGNAVSAVGFRARVITAGTAGTNMAAIGEIEFLDSNGARISTVGGVAFDSAIEPGFDGEEAFDQIVTAGNGFKHLEIGGSAVGAWCGMIYPSAVQPYSVRFTPIPGSETQMPLQLAVDYTHDTGNWFPVRTLEATTWPDADPQTFDLYPNVDNLALGDLSDVGVTTAQDGNVLKYDASNGIWYPAEDSTGSSSPPGSVSLNDLTDVDTTGFGDGSVLAYDASNGTWYAAPNRDIGIQEWAPNFTANGDMYIPALEAMTISQGVATIGTGTIAYTKSTAAAPSTFGATSLPATLEAGAWLKMTVTGFSGFLATHLLRTA